MEDVLSSRGVSCEQIRRDWPKYKDELRDTAFYDMIWNDLEKKRNIDSNDPYLPTLKRFINGEEIICKSAESTGPLCNSISIKENILYWSGLNTEERSKIHTLCDKIGLDHRSRGINRIIQIRKSEPWYWEFTMHQTWKKQKPVFARLRLAHQPFPRRAVLSSENPITELVKKENAINEELRNTKCNICHKNGLETELSFSVHFRGAYCDECIYVARGKDGNPLWVHKCESVTDYFHGWQ